MSFSRSLWLALAAAWIACPTIVRGQTLAELQQDYVDRGFGMFLHFNMGTFTGEEWASPSQPVDTFNPVGLDTDQWAAAASAAGMTYAVLTTKHHDGFALWDTSRSTYDVASTTWHANAEASEAGSGDIVKRFADSFAAEGIAVCLYYSIWDRTHGIDGSTLSGTEATAYVKDELTELLTNYGPIACIWTDGWGWRGYYDYVDFTEVYNHIKTLSPTTLLVENSHSESNTDIRTWEQNFPTAGNTFPSEASATIRADNKWFWSAGADDLKSIGNLVGQRLMCNERSAAYLLDVTPDQTGNVPASQVAQLAALGGAVNASGVNWGPAFEVASVADLDLTGSNIVAINGGNEDVSIGGVTFSGFTGTDFQPVTAQPAGQTTTAAEDVLGFAGDKGIYSAFTDDVDLDILLDTHIYTDSPVDMTTQLTGLTPGQWYRVQVVAPADDRAASGLLDRTVVVDGARLIHRFADIGGDGQRHVSSVTGTFLAAGPTLDLVTSGPWGGGWSALIVSEIEDPTSTPDLQSPSVSSVTGTSAQANVSLATTGAEVTLYWDTVDQGTGTWGQSADLGPQAVGPVSGAITGLAPDTEYFYRFHAVNTVPEPDTEDWSPAGTVFTTALAGLAPASPLASINFVPDPKTEIDVEWTDVFNTETGFVIERSPDGIGSWVGVGTAGPDQQIFYDSGLQPDTTYYYRVFGENAAGLSDPSEVVSATTDPPTPGIEVQAWYRMGDEGVGAANRPLDSSGFGADFVSAIGSATVSPAGGGYEDDSYYAFSGSSQAYYDIGGYDPPEDHVGIEVWARTSNLTQANTHLFGTGSNVTGLNIGFDAGGDRGWFGAVGGIAYIGTQGLSNYTAGEWVHLAVVREGGTATFYINGVASGTSTAVPNDANGTGPGALHMAVTSGGTAYFQGDLGEARIFTFDPGQFDVSQLLYLPGGGGGYADWTAGFAELGSSDPEVDDDGGGLPTGIEWVTGGDPSKGSDDAGQLPVFDNASDPDDVLFTFRRRDAAEADAATTIVVDYGSDLAGWRNTTDHGAVDGVAIDTLDLGGGFHEVTVAIPKALAANGRLFARLRVEIAVP